MAKAINNKRIGIIGGGQLGRMMILEGKKMGISFVILDPTKSCPASSIADEHIVADFYDIDRIKELARKCDVVTYEFEHINADILIELKDKGSIIYPPPESLKIIQDKLKQNLFLKDNNFPTPSFTKVESIEDIYLASKKYGFPIMLKSRKGGYDGKGNFLINEVEEIPLAYKSLRLRSDLLMVEEFVPFELEISVTVARGIVGDIKVYPISENIHRDNILYTSIVPARVEYVVTQRAKKLALEVIEQIKGIGVLCIEMFVTKDEKIYVNEIAPRTHNSGHYTIEGCATSQFMQHIRAILGLPLGKTDLIKPCVMINLLGESEHEGRGVMIGAQDALAICDVNIHYYGKIFTKPVRKMGHVTILGENINDALAKSDKVRKLIKIVSEDEV
ncbi:MAG: 5-(carboxyamino)imidazole ribonucleotide synthase [Clostridiales bacterium]|nr:5-(carboxyamino)imidazole ribonucleotide synthase [Clostridiales bacterium]